MRTLEEQTAAARQVLRDVFGFDGFRPGQEAAIEALLAGRNVLTVMPTGSGKSLCFQIPALMTDGLAVVVSPLVALMQDQVAALRLAGVAADSINSAKARADNIAAWRRAAAGETRLLYMAPERLMTEPMLASLARLPVTLFAIDEAHCISQWGPAFRPEYEDLCGLRLCCSRVVGVHMAAPDQSQKPSWNHINTGHSTTFETASYKCGLTRGPNPPRQGEWVRDQPSPRFAPCLQRVSGFCSMPSGQRQ